MSLLRPGAARVRALTLARAGVRSNSTKANEAVPAASQPPSRAPSPAASAAPSAMQKALPLLFSRRELEAFPRLLQTRDATLDGSGANFVRKAPDAQNVYGASVAVYNEADDRHYPTPPLPVQNVMRQSGGAGEEVNSEAYLSSVTPLTAAEVQALHRYNITLKRVVNMTGKGRVASWYALVVAGNGKGLVGYGEGKDMNAGRANKKAFHAAVKNMDLVAVHRAKSGANTVETSVEGHWGATRVVIRPRPAGFGLRVPNVIHPIARAAGFSDLSAAVYGSSNAMNVVKAALQVLWGGSAPIGQGNGVRGKMRRDNKGQGARSRRDMELSRGRRLEELDMDR
ncbi:28S ribosomal protein S5, mitochondrial [Malassezia brasiliensis]|uniref:Small ribosomal subunit protein uS5m n=1 Tax=Malassezia brasiliensis TaxID=1821822 RepID=A0AAF0IPG7_9BASI|nr:28S ribosomal protein S5, mitochondrial [Malassezia brasiliensis]